MTSIAVAACIAVVVLLIALAPMIRSRFNYTTVDVAGRPYHVVADYSNRDAAAALLNRTNAHMLEFMRYLKRKYHVDEPDDVIAEEQFVHQRIVTAPNDVYNIVCHMLIGYDPDQFYENDPRYSKDTSYTVGKGAAMYVCLRDKAHPDQLVDENTLLFVMLHEASHIANYRGWGHIRAFWETFKFILHEAQTAGFYTPADYARRPVMYCGLLINYQPLFDDSVRNLWVD